MEMLIMMLLIKHSAPGAVPAKQLAIEIQRVSDRFEVDSLIVTKIVLTESGGREGAYNARTHDYGIMQINERTAASYGFTKACLRNWRCNLRAGAKILSDIDSWSKDGRVCRYNVGSGVLKQDKLQKCLHYELKLANIK